MKLAHRLSLLRGVLAEKGLDGYVIWRGDMFQGEEVRACDERLAYISGFTGSAGYALVTADAAYVFSDGRYHLQMQNQLDGQLWRWRDAAQGALVQALEEIAATSQKKSFKLGFDGQTTSLSSFRKLPAAAGALALEWEMSEGHLIDQIWQDRPAAPRQNAYSLSDDVTGQSRADKLDELQDALAAADVAGLIETSTDCVNWLMNIRGDDLPCTPFHLAFAYVPQKGAPTLIEAQIDKAMGKSISLDECNALFASLGGQRIQIDPASLPYALYQSMVKNKIEMAEKSSPLSLPKARKNKTELAGFTKAHEKDALAFCRFWFDIDHDAQLTMRRETDLVRQLASMRQQMDGYLCDSFETIMGAGGNGAIIHYRAIEGADSLIQNDNLLLIDSGAHYDCGTTDITRTLLVGAPDDEMIAAYSAVLAGHIALADCRFPEGTTGQALDAICRAPLWEAGYDFAHGTGHGVGHILSVHEGPCSISKRGQVPLEEGMVLSNEPGYYLQDRWGIRLENLVYVTDADDGFHRFHTLTMVPFERRLIDKDKLPEAALRWLNDYHRAVFDLLAPSADGEMRPWLEEKCAPL